MVIDSSALIAILEAERDGKALLDAVEAAPVRLLSSATLVEASMVILSRQKEAGLTLFDTFLVDMDIEVVSVTEAHARRFPALRQGAAPGWPEFRGLPVLRPRQGDGRAAAVQGRRLRAHRRRSAGRAMTIQATVVVRIFRDYADGLSPKAIATALNRAGVPLPTSPIR